MDQESQPPPPPPPVGGKGRRVLQHDAYSCVCRTGYSSSDDGHTCTPDALCTEATCQNGGTLQQRELALRPAGFPRSICVF